MTRRDLLSIVQRKPTQTIIQFPLIRMSLVMIVLHLMSQSKCIQRRISTRNVFSCLLEPLYTKLYSNSQNDFLLKIPALLTVFLLLFINVVGRYFLLLLVFFLQYYQQLRLACCLEMCFCYSNSEVWVS